jgi:hypothetical protein
MLEAAGGRFGCQRSRIVAISMPVARDKFKKMSGKRGKNRGNPEWHFR